MLCEGRGGRNILIRGRKSILPSFLSAPGAKETRGGGGGAENLIISKAGTYAHPQIFFIRGRNELFRGKTRGGICPLCPHAGHASTTAVYFRLNF